MIHSGMTMQGQSHVADPSVNLGDSSFLDGIGGPGFLTEQMNDFEHDGRITNSSGQTEPGSGSINSVSGWSHVAWLAHQQVLGGWYGMEIVGTAAYVDAGSQGHIGGFGDLTVSPLILQWPEKRVFGIPIDQRFDESSRPILPLTSRNFPEVLRCSSYRPFRGVGQNSQVAVKSCQLNRSMQHHLIS
jgi:hypothetical protein